MLAPLHVDASTNREQRYSSNPFATSGLERGGWSAPGCGHFTPGKDPVSIVQETRCVAEPSGQVPKISPPTRFDARTVQPVASLHRFYTKMTCPSMTLMLSHAVTMLVFFMEIIFCAAFPGGRVFRRSSSTLLLPGFLLLNTTDSASTVTGRKSKFVWVEIFLYLSRAAFHLQLAGGLHSPPT